MSDFKNPFDPDNHSAGGGVWDGKTVTITSAKFVLDPIMYGDGSPYLDKETGEPAFVHCLKVTGIAEGEERERKESWSIGYMVPTGDGEGFESPDGKPGKMSLRCECSKFFAALKKSGFKMANIAKDDAPYITGLVGAQFEMEGIQKVKDNGELKFSKNGYPDIKFYPVSFVGYDANGRPGAVDDAIKDRAAEIVMTLLAESSNGKLTRVDLIKSLTSHLGNDPDKNTILALAMKPDFHEGQQWFVDGSTLSVVPF